MRQVFLSAIIMTAVALLLASCGGDDNPVTSANQAPNQPAIDGSSSTPDDGATGASRLSTLAWTGSDPDGDVLTYTVAFGNTTPPPTVSTDQTGLTYSPPQLAYNTPYYWSVTAKDPGGASTSSAVWSFTTLLLPTETVSAPDAPAGPASSETDQALTYTASGAVSSYGDAIQYQFDWGDNSTTSWVSPSAQHAYANAGSYYIKTQARCTVHQTILSEWSDSTAVIITPAAGETVSIPDAPSGPASGVTNSGLDYSISGAASSLSHLLEYQFDWGDGSISLWSTSTVGGHGYTDPNTYDIKVKGRCAVHTSIESAWSPSTQVVVTVPPETLTPLPGPISGVTDGEINQAFTYDCIHGPITNLGDQMEGQYDWGDGSTSAWVQWQERSQMHTWTAEGTYTVKYQARCSVHNSFVVHADTLVVTIATVATETVSKPPFMSGPSVGNVGVALSWFAIGGISSLGHALEVRFDWGDGSALSVWGPENVLVSHIYTSVGTYPMLRQARCAAHPSVESVWSDPKNITINP